MLNHVIEWKIAKGMVIMLRFRVKYVLLANYVFQINSLKRYEEYRRSLKITVFGSLLILFRQNSNFSWFKCWLGLEGSATLLDSRDSWPDFFVIIFRHFHDLITQVWIEKAYSTSFLHHQNHRNMKKSELGDRLTMKHQMGHLKFQNRLQLKKYRGFPIRTFLIWMNRVHIMLKIVHSVTYHQVRDLYNRSRKKVAVEKPGI